MCVLGRIPSPTPILAEKILRTVFRREYLKDMRTQRSQTFPLPPSSLPLRGLVFTLSQEQFGLGERSQLNRLCNSPEGVTCRTHQKFIGKLLFVTFLVLGFIQELVQNFFLVHAAGQERQSMSGLREGMSNVCHGRGSSEKPPPQPEKSMSKAVVYWLHHKPERKLVYTSLCGLTTKPLPHSRALAPASFSRKEPGDNSSFSQTRR